MPNDRKDRDMEGASQWWEWEDFLYLFEVDAKKESDENMRMITSGRAKDRLNQVPCEGEECRLYRQTYIYIYRHIYRQKILYIQQEERVLVKKKKTKEKQRDYPDHFENVFKQKIRTVIQG